MLLSRAGQRLRLALIIYSVGKLPPRRCKAAREIIADEGGGGSIQQRRRRAERGRHAFAIPTLYLLGGKLLVRRGGIKGRLLAALRNHNGTHEMHRDKRSCPRDLLENQGSDSALPSR